MRQFTGAACCHNHKLQACHGPASSGVAAGTSGTAWGSPACKSAANRRTVWPCLCTPPNSNIALVQACFSECMQVWLYDQC